MKLLLIVALVACLALLVASTFLTPVSNDAGAYLTIADRWLHGWLPYRDIFDHKTPGIYALFALILAASGRSLVAVQLAQLAGLLLCTGLTAWIAWRRWSRLAGALAGLLALYGSAAYAGAHLTVEAWVALATALALALLLRRKDTLPTPADWFTAGLLVGGSALFKQTGLLTLVAFGLWVWLLGGGWRPALRRWLWLLAGCTLPLAVMALYFAAAGALPDLWRDAVLVNLTSYPRLGWATLLRGNLTNLRTFPLLWLGVALALWAAPPRLRRSVALADKGATLLWLTLLTGLLPLLNRPYGHYVLQALPAATILAGVGLAGGWRWLEVRTRGSEGMDARLRGHDGAEVDARLHLHDGAEKVNRRGHDEAQIGSSPRRRGSRVILAVALVGVIALALIDLPRWPGYLAYTSALVRSQAQAAAAVTQMTQPDEPILVVTDAPQIYFLSDRPPATRWQYLLPVNYTPEREAELANLITTYAVRIVVTDSADQRWHTDLKRAADQSCALLDTFGNRFTIYNCSQESALTRTHHLPSARSGPRPPGCFRDHLPTATCNLHPRRPCPNPSTNAPSTLSSSECCARPTPRPAGATRRLHPRRRPTSPTWAGRDGQPPRRLRPGGTASSPPSTMRCARRGRPLWR